MYALVKTLKAFRNYVLQSQIIAYVPNYVVKDVLVQSDVEGKRGKWPIRGILRSKMGLLRKMYNQNKLIRTNKIQHDDVNHGG